MKSDRILINNTQKTWKLFSMFFVMLVFSCFPFVTHAEKINVFSTMISASNIDDHVLVSELIQYDFEGVSRHGIYRTIPLKNKDGSMLNIDNIRIENATLDGVVPFTTEYKNSELNIKIGDPNVLVTGIQTYNIFYSVVNATVAFSDYDELYWNVTGNGWNVPIERAQAYISINGTDLQSEHIKQMACYRGKIGSTDTCSIIFTEDINNHPITAEVFNLNPKEGMTIAIGLQKGFIAAPVRTEFPNSNEAIPWYKDKKFEFIMNSIIGLFGLVMFLGIIAKLYRLWKTKTHQTIIAEYEPPTGFTPMLAGVMMDMNADPKDVTAAIIELARCGIITIERKESKKFIFESIDYIFTLKNREKVTEKDKSILSIIFGPNQNVGAINTFTNIKKQRTLFSTLIENINNQSLVELVERKLIQTESFALFPEKVAEIFAAIAFILAAFLQSGFLWLIIPAIATIAFLREGKYKYTKEGQEVKNHLLGFKGFLSVTDKDRFDFHNAPEKKPEQFMQYLPYAIAFGVEKKWAEQFKGITISNPVWYNGPSNHVFIASEFVTHMTAIGENISSAVIPASSGSGGGGFSGGGSGGGGGGSW